MEIGVIYNYSLLTLEYLIYDIDEQIINTKEARAALQFGARVSNVCFYGFQRRDYVMTLPKYQNQFRQIQVNDKVITKLDKEEFGKKKLCVRTTVGAYVNYLIKDYLIEIRQDMCLKILPDLQYRLLNSQQISSQFGEPQNVIGAIIGGGDRPQNNQYLQEKKLKNKYTSQQLYDQIEKNLKQVEKQLFTLPHFQNDRQIIYKRIIEPTQASCEKLRKGNQQPFYKYKDVLCKFRQYLNEQKITLKQFYFRILVDKQCKISQLQYTEIMQKQKESNISQEIDQFFKFKLLLMTKNWSIDKSDLKTILQKGNFHFSPQQVEQLFNQIIDSENMNLKFPSQNKYNKSHIQINRENRLITSSILKSEAIIDHLIDAAIQNNGFIKKSIVQGILSNLNYANKEGSNFKDQIFDDNDEIAIEYFFQKIRYAGQSKKLDKSQSKNICMDKILGQIAKLNKYFNRASKLDKDFVQIAIHYLENGLIYKEKIISYKQNINGGYLLKYNLFSSEEQLARKDLNKLSKYIQAKDVIQGQISDCYFLSAMAALAFRHPELIYRLFVLFKNPSHIYGVRLFIDGKWETVWVDMKFLIKQHKYLYGAQPNGNIWPMILQKAYAKVNESYDKIQFGNDQEGIQILTGAPSIYYLPIKRVFKEMCKEQFKRGSILTASIMVGSFARYKTKDDFLPSQSEIQQRGLMINHSYSILDVIPLQGSNGQVITLIKVRNPWGNNQKIWNGPWSFHSRVWDGNIQLRKQLGYQLDPKDGSFFICQGALSHYFTFVNICRIQQNYINSWIDLQCKNDEFTAIEIKIKSKGNYSFTAYLKGRRKYPKDALYNERYCLIFLLQKKKKQGQKLKRFCNLVRKDNNTIQSEGDLEEGQYMILLKVKWLHDKQQQYRLTSYGPQQVLMQPQPFKESYLHDYIQSPSKIPQIGRFDSSRNIYREVKIYDDFGYGFIAIMNEQKYSFNVKIGFGWFQPFITVLQPHKFPINLHVAPEQTVICKFITMQAFQHSIIKYEFKFLDPVQQ